MSVIRFKCTAVFVSLFAALLIMQGCSETENPVDDPGTSIGGKVSTAERNGSVLTFTPSDQFYTARFYSGKLAFADVKGTKWSERMPVATLAVNLKANDGVNDWKSPFDLAGVTELTAGASYTMVIFFTADEMNESQQAIITFTR
jgi:hypothetical protein